MGKNLKIVRFLDFNVKNVFENLSLKFEIFN